MTDSVFRHFKYGEPAATYSYNDVHVVARYLHEGRKEIVPWSLIDGRWQMKSADKPRPLYNAQALTNGTKAVVVEGEKCVDHLKKLGVSRVPICWPGGSGAVKHADWSALYGRDVLLFPDHDDPGHKCMLWLAGELLKNGSTVSVVRHTADDLPEGWDVADTTWDKPELNQWLTGRIQPITEIEPPEVPRETPVTRGKPRMQPNGQPPNGLEIDPTGGSIFITWQQLGLTCFDGKPPHPNLDNIQKILGNHPELAGKVWFDEFHGKVFQALFQEEPAEWADHHDTRMTVWIQRKLNLHKIGHQLVRQAVEDYARLNIRNEVREWMDGLAWDGVPRLAVLMKNGFGAEYNPYTAAVGRCWMVSMVARTYEPGCKVDTMPVFEGNQGLRKSSALAAIGGRWFAEVHEDVTSKDFLQTLPGKILIEIPELHQFKQADVDKIKGIISCPVDRYRASYGHRAADHPRRCVWCGSTNRDDYNRDDTGARRLWPIACSAINTEWIAEMRNQLFAEAVQRYRDGEPWWDIDPDLAKAEQELRRADDVWSDVILGYIDGHTHVHIRDILTNGIGKPLIDIDKRDEHRVASILKVNGWSRVQRKIAGQNVKVWVNSTQQK